MGGITTTELLRGKFLDGHSRSPLQSNLNYFHELKRKVSTSNTILVLKKSLSLNLFYFIVTLLHLRNIFCTVTVKGIT